MMHNKHIKRHKDKERGFNISAWSIQHPWVIISFFVAVVTLAMIAIFGGVMPRRMMPYVESPLVGIVTMMPGLSAQEMETYISKPIEERMTDIRGARYIRSTSQDGLSVVSLEFPYGSDIKKATQDVQSLMNSVQADLPQTGANLKPSWVLPIDPLNIPILSISVTGDADKGWTPVALRQFAENEGVRAIKQVADVQSVEVYGGRKRQLRVQVNRDKLAAYGYSILDVRDAIDKNSVAKPAGVITSGPNESIVRVSGLAQNAQTIADYPLGTKNGSVVYLRDVASVADDVREQRRVVLATRERLMALEPRGRGILATSLRTDDEVRAADQVFGAISDAEPDAGMIAIAQKIIEQQEGPFDPSQFVDRYEQALKALIAEKQKGEKPVAAPEPEDTNVVDLMSALRASLGGKGDKADKADKPTPKSEPKAPAKPRRRKAG